MAIEIELRARVGRETFKRIQADIAAAGSVKIQNRCFIDYSTFIEGIGERTLDVRLRVTNGVPEFIVKRGTFGATKREEASARIFSEDLEGGLSFMSLTGYSKGVCGGRRIQRATIGDIEVALQEVLDFNNPKSVPEAFVEVEYVGPASQESDAVEILQAKLNEWGLKPFSTDEWNSFIADLNEKWNGVYTHGETSIDVVRELGG